MLRKYRVYRLSFRIKQLLWFMSFLKSFYINAVIVIGMWSPPTGLILFNKRFIKFVIVVGSTHRYICINISYFILYMIAPIINGRSRGGGGWTGPLSTFNFENSCEKSISHGFHDLQLCTIYLAWLTCRGV